MGEVKNFDQPDETRTFDRGRLDIVEVRGQQVGRAVFEPGWRWSESVRPIAGTETCQVEHLVYVVSGEMGVAYDDGTMQEIRAGALAHLPAGHLGRGHEPLRRHRLHGFPELRRPALGPSRRTHLPSRCLRRRGRGRCKYTPVVNDVSWGRSITAAVAGTTEPGS